MSLKAAVCDNRRIPAVTAEQPGEGADRSTRVAEELAGAPAKLQPAQPVSNFGEPDIVGSDGRPRSGRIGPVALLRLPNLKEALMSIAAEVDDLQSAVRNALLTTRATAACPFHPEVTIRSVMTRPKPTLTIAQGTSSEATALAGIMIC